MMKPQLQFLATILAAVVTATAPVMGTSAVPNDPIMEPVSELMHTRSTVSLSRQPNLNRLIKAVDGRNLNLQLTGEGADGDGEIISGSLWGEFTSSTLSGDADGGYLFMASGVHQQVSDNFIIGGMIQYDQIEEAYGGGGTIDGSGWLVGPYFAVQPLEQSLYFSGSVLYGNGDNDIVFFDSTQGRRYGSFDSQRLVANLNVSGEFALEYLGDIKLIPYATAGYIKDDSDSFTDNNNVRVLGQSLTLTQFDSGLRFSIPLEIAGGEVNLNGGKGVILSYIDSESGDEASELRSRIELGYSYEAVKDLLISLNGFYDGLYTGFESWGTTVNVEKKF